MVDGACLNDDRLVAFLTGTLPPTDVDAVDAHIDGCARCLELVTVSARCIPTPRSESSSDPISSWSTGGASPSPEPLEPPRSLLPRGAVVAERYAIVDVAGIGAMGVVYAAHDRKLDRRVALKVLRWDRFGEAEIGRAQARLVREAQILARLSHPGVTAVYDVGTTRGDTFIVMELVEGQSAREWLEGPRPRGAEAILEVFVQAGRGLAAAHAAGIVHRDFKPDNVLVGVDGRGRVTDFGLARPARSEERPPASASSAGAALQLGFSTLREGRALVGTPRYMAPEQLGGADADAKSDQFAFCVALHEALHGAHPFPAADVAGLVAAVERGPVRPRDRARSVPAWLDEVLARGLGLDAGARFPSMDALCGAIERGRSRRRRQWLWLGAVIAAGALGVTAAPMLSIEPAARGASAAPSAEPEPSGVAELRAAFEQVSSLTVAERFDEASGLASQTLARARETGFPPVEADALCALGSVQLARLRASEAQATFEEAVRISEASKYHKTTVQALLGLSWAAAGLGRMDDALGATIRAEAVLSRWTAAPSRTRADVWSHRSLLLRERGEHRDAIVAEREALRLLELDIELKELPSRDPKEIRIASSLVWLGASYAALGQHEEALEVGRRALAIRERDLGPEHTRVAGALTLIAASLAATGKTDEARATYDRALAMRERLLGEKHVEVAHVLAGLSELQQQLGQLEDGARSNDRALAIYEDRLGAEHDLSRRERARKGALLAARRLCKAAVPLVEQAVASLPPGPDERAPQRAATLADLGHASLLCKQGGAARDLLERALRAQDSIEGAMGEAARVRFDLATALWPEPAHRTRARALATQARDEYAEAGSTPRARDVEAWLASHRGG